jgi:hypothetical protein
LYNNFFVKFKINFFRNLETNDSSEINISYNRFIVGRKIKWFIRREVENKLVIKVRITNDSNIRIISIN